MIKNKERQAKMNSEQNGESSSKEANIKKNNRRSFLLLLAVFILPIVLAKFALEGKWLATGVTNNGTLLTDELTLEKLGVDQTPFDNHWLILYNLPQTCSIHCQKTLEAIHNTYIALGKDMPRAIPVAMYQEALSSDQLQHISQSKWQLIETPDQVKAYVQQPQILIADPLGNVFLSHHIPDNIEQLTQFGKKVLVDMKKLLKYSKVG